MNTTTNTPPRGKLIVLEGIDGSGTTTQVQKLASLLECSAVREPSGVLEPGIRDFINPESPCTASPSEMAVLFTASMLMNRHSLEYELAQGFHVVSDRHSMSTLVYQGDGTKERAALGWLAMMSSRPDLTILLDIEPELAFERIAARKSLDQYEGNRDMQERLRDAYLLEAQDPYHNCRVIDGSKPAHEVFEAIKAELWRAGIHHD